MAKLKIKDNTKAILKESDRLIKERLGKACLLVERSAKEECPVLTGTARRSILSNWWGAKGMRSVNWAGGNVIAKGKKVNIKPGKTMIPPQTQKRGVVGSNVEYFPHIERGTAKMTAFAPLRKALHKNMRKIKQIFGAI
jgi:hypothetical protein